MVYRGPDAPAHLSPEGRDVREALGVAVASRSEGHVDNDAHEEIVAEHGVFARQRLGGQV